jgi:hypothetical protein
VVVDAEVSEMLGRRLERAVALEALAARAELADRLGRHRWLAFESARRAGASWADIDAAADLGPGEARREYERVLASQKSLGLADALRADPGGPHA